MKCPSAVTGLLFASIAAAQPLPTPLERNHFTKASTHEELVAHLNELAAASPRLTVETLGTSTQGRVIPLVHVAPRGPGEKLRVMLFCQQHGNEPSGKEAALLLLSRIAAGAEEALLERLDLTIVPSVNPDGNASAERFNGAGADLNRNHLLLAQPEVLALHRAFARIQPEATLDVHEYPPFSKSWVSAGRVPLMDEQFGAPTNLNVPPGLTGFALTQLFPYLDAELAKQGIRFFNYIKLDSAADTARSSTTSINDGRQSFAIQGAFSFILEGRNGNTFNDELQRRSSRQLAAIRSFLGFLSARAPEVRALVQAGIRAVTDSRAPVVLQMDHVPDGSTLNIPVQVLKTGAASTLEVKYAPSVKALKSVERPAAYVIPAAQTALIAFLDRHGVTYDRVEQPRRQSVEIYTERGDSKAVIEGKNLHIPATRKRTELISLAPGDVVVPLDQRQGTMLVIALEPESMWGLAQYEEFAALRTPGRDYPVYRIRP
jgi:hypothetical protein